MPLKKCSENGKSGWKYGDSGKCYTGKDGKKQAIRQGLAIDGSEKFKEEMSKGSLDKNMTPSDYLYAKSCLQDWDSCEAKVKKIGTKYKILGQGKKFDTLSDAVKFQYNQETPGGADFAYQSEKNEAEPNEDNQDNPMNTQTKPKLISDDAVDADKIYDQKSKTPSRIKQVPRSKQLVAQAFQNDNLDEMSAAKLADYLSSYGYISKKERNSIPKEDYADPEHEKYPIRNQKELNSAVKLAGRSTDISPDEVRKNIKKIAKRKGLKLPESWEN